MPKIHATAPVLLVDDVQRAAEFYRDKLGFTVGRLWGEPPCFCMPSRDGFIIMLSQVPRDELTDTEWRRQEGVWSAYLWTDDAKALHDEWVARGVTVQAPLCAQEYDILEFTIRDLDGHFIGVGQPI